ncbi:MAG: hypothetical protein M1817_004680 [Caeruleum heppii]|nr:MAG: hypothetical protein M1817_004680 [Caeruleum heppii]
MHMKSVHSTGTGKGITGSNRRHIISRLHKAAENSKQLYQVLLQSKTSRASDGDILEARAYTSSLAGAVDFEKADWQACLKAYSESRVIYSALQTSTGNDIFKDMLASTIDPSIRYAAYQSHIPRTLAIATVARRSFPKDDQDLVSKITQLDADALTEDASASSGTKSGDTSTTPKTITWRSRTVDLQDAAIATALGTASSASDVLLQSLSEHPGKRSLNDRALAYDDVLNASQDAVDATKHAIDELVSEGVGQGDKRMQALQITWTAVNYALIRWRVGRNRVLTGEADGMPLDGGIVKQPKKPRKDGKEWVEKEVSTGRKLAFLREKVVLYDATLQSIDSVRDLPGVAADADFLKQLHSKRSFFQALKCLAIARSHELLSNRKNSLALLARASDLLSQALPSSSSPASDASEPPTLDIHPDSFSALQKMLKAELARAHALVELDALASSRSPDAESSPTTEPPLIERLHEYPSSGLVDLSNLVTYPPKLQPVPVKPIFLDLAWNYIEYPGRAKQVVKEGVKGASEGKATVDEKGAKKEEGRKGWFGFGR